MVKSVAGIRPTAAFLIALLLIVSLAVVPMAEGAVQCPLESKRSKTWFGVCGKSKNCDNQCRTWERAKHGACHITWKRVWGVKVPTGSACFCYFCKKH